MAEGDGGWNALRKQRYASDPEYREKAKKWSREFKAKRRADRELRKARASKPAGPAHSWKTVDVEVNGVLTPMFTLGVLPKVFGKALSTLRMWEAKGVLPETPYRSWRGDRLYTYDMIVSIRNELVQTGRVAKVVPKREPNKLRMIDKNVRFANGEVQRLSLYRVLTLAEVLGKSTSQLWALENDGLLPVSPLRTTKMKHRLYTPAMIQAVRAVLERFGYPRLLRRRNPAVLIYNAIWDEWEKLGMRGAEVVDDEGSDCDGRSGAGAAVGAGGRRRETTGVTTIAVGAPDGGDSSEALQARRCAG